MAKGNNSMQTIHMFVSYSHGDSRWVQAGKYDLIPWLEGQLRRDDVQIWSDHALKLMPGAEYKKLIQSEIERADFAILLISQDFVGSEFIQEYELPWIRAQAERDELGLITILVGPVCDEDLDWLADRQMLPGKPTPLIGYRDNEADWQQVRIDILQAIRSRLRALRASSARGQAEQRDIGQEPRPAATVPATACPPVASVVAVPAATSSPESPASSRPSRSETLPAELSAASSATVPSPPATVGGATSREPVATAPVGKTAVPENPEIVTPSGSPLEVITNSLGMQMVLIPAGEFLMGSPDTEAERQGNESPQRGRRIERAFYLGMYPVTQGDYERIMGRNPSHFSVSGGGHQDVEGLDTRLFPVESVSWEDAVELCRRLSLLPEERAAGREYRLPTETEWEYACRAETTTPFHFGALLNGREANCHGNHPYGTIERGPFLGRTTRVGSYSPNTFGLYDMHGNVWEWCVHGYWNYRFEDIDPANVYRIYRGGSWSSQAFKCRAAFRTWNAPTVRHSNTGFRVAMTASGRK